MKEGATIAAVGIVAGLSEGFMLARAIASYISDVSLPGMVPTLGAALVLVVAALLASLVPAARARVSMSSTRFGRSSRSAMQGAAGRTRSTACLSMSAKPDVGPKFSR